MGGKIGVLALQGAFAKHLEMLENMGVDAMPVRYGHELSHCIGLILPGGESTTINTHIEERGLTAPLKDFAHTHPLFGTCAGMILMAREGILSLMEISVARNAYGRQRASFTAPLSLSFSPLTIEAFFIRAPRIVSIHSPDVQILAELDGEAVLVQHHFHLAASFHPELTNDREIHKYFVELCKVKQSLPQLSTITHTKCFQTI